MNDIRKETSGEETVAVGTFKVPLVLAIYFWFWILLFGLSGGHCLAYGLNRDHTLALVGGIILLICFFFVSLYYFLFWLSLKRSNLTISDKRIYGKKAHIIGANLYSYRLDSIVQVDLHGILGITLLKIQFDDGTKVPHLFNILGLGNIFFVRFLGNAKEVHKALSDRILLTKSEREVDIELAAKRIEAEERKAAALENLGGSDIKEKAGSGYIQEIKALKGLLDEGIITEEEFEAKKKKLLGE